MASSSRSLQAHRVADAHRPLAQHACIEPAPARIDLLRHAREVAVAEVRPQVVARPSIGGELELDLAHLELRARHHLLPGYAAEREVLADAADVDRMALGLQRADQLQRIQAHRARRAAVVAQIALAIRLDSLEANGGRAARDLRHAAVGNIDRMKRAAQALSLARRST